MMHCRWEHFGHGADIGVRGLAAINCAMANRQILTHLVREVFHKLLPAARLPLLYDVSHNTCKPEQHRVHGPIPRDVSDTYPWGEALGELEHGKAQLRIINLETAVTKSNAT